MSVNDVLMKFFKLPPGVRMMLALLGFGSLAAIFMRFARPLLRSKDWRVWGILLGIIAAGLLVFLVIYLVRKARSGKRASELDEALDSQGPTRRELTEEQQAYREKFREKLGQLKNEGKSVYEMPWFVLIGEPGCGKTASLLHSDIDFPFGREELRGVGGTHNYNWWFTDTAVILDTAGRYAFHEEGTKDRTEWEYFLKLLRKHRPRCPINGLIVALPADKLLEDTAEERDQKANILRDRLRQIHQTLGVRFPVFIVVTKVDKVYGFSDFAEELRPRLEDCKQMFGWSRPGELEEPFDPAAFPAAFDDVYHRVRDYAMRFLQRRADDVELGRVVTFPEALRNLREPLHDYIATIFKRSALVEPPFFRGFYFTSAVQEGAPVMSVFGGRSGRTPSAPEPTAASRAFFIHDFYEDKVFAEHGLVFRSAKDVTLNKRMRRMVGVSSVAMFLLMVVLLIFGWVNIAGLLEAPVNDCEDARKQFVAEGAAPPSYENLPQHVELAQGLWAHYKRYDGAWPRIAATALFIGADLDVPQGAVRDVHARYVLEAILAPLLEETTSRLSASDARTLGAERRARYLDALEVYTRWYGHLVGQRPLRLDDSALAIRRDVETFLTFLGDTGPQDQEDALQQLGFAFENLAPRDFTKDVLAGTLAIDRDAWTGTIVACVESIRESWLPETQLDEGGHYVLQYWRDFAAQIEVLNERYSELLALADAFGGTAHPDADDRERFAALTRDIGLLGDPDSTPTSGSLAAAYDSLRRFLSEREVPEDQRKIIRLRDLPELLAARWDAELKPLEDALAEYAPDRNGEPQSEVYEAVAGARERLAESLEANLAQIWQRLAVAEGESLLETYVKQGLLAYEEAKSVNDTKAQVWIRLAGDALGRGDQLRAYLVELRDIVESGGVTDGTLDDLRAWPRLLQRIGSSQPPGEALQGWFSRAEAGGGRSAKELEQTRRDTSGLGEVGFWRPAGLYTLAAGIWSWNRDKRSAALIGQMEDKLREVNGAEVLPGLARLMPGFDKDAGLPFREHRYNSGRTDFVVGESGQAGERDKKPVDLLERLRRGSSDRKTDDGGAAQPAQLGPRALAVSYHTREWLLATAGAYQGVLEALERRRDTGEVVKVLNEAFRTYVQSYFGDWWAIYGDYTELLDERTLALLQACRDDEMDWRGFCERMDDGGSPVGSRESVTARLQSFAEHALSWYIDPDMEWPGNTKDTIIKHWALYQELRDVCNAQVALSVAGGGAVVPRSGELGSALSAAWRDYCKQVSQIGPGLRSVASDELPSRAALVEAFNRRCGDAVDTSAWSQPPVSEFHFLKPLLDIAEYGEGLLAHELSQKLGEVFGDYAGRYPLVGDATDDSAELHRLNALARDALATEQLIGFLVGMGEFERDYGAMFERVRGSDPAARRARALARQWQTFILGKTDLDPTLDLEPNCIHVDFVIVQAKDALNAAAYYSRMRASFPLLTDTCIRTAPPFEYTVSDYDVKRISVGEAFRQREQAGDGDFRWRLPVGGSRVSYSETSVELFDLNERATGQAARIQTAWTLPATPWSLPLLAGASTEYKGEDGLWVIPLRLQTNPQGSGKERETIGFDVGVRFDPPLPGTIPPYEPDETRPRLENAGIYLGDGSR